ncbi:coniferyl-alcohol dehydrogenase [Cucumibacter marinus]|uniref:coniferyl-alcohol dehydrogenase n=1 Tax=Cucumibacter marinus TaxID=1121252 RepID=UPI0003FFB9FB|nr:coniferyl-alcohol dehydrogenase [Cucumibacter marinus]
MIFGKTIVVTGAASGIGKRTAELAARMGADVIGIDINEPAIPAGRFLKGDLSSPEGVAEIAMALPDRIDGLCNIAGLSGRAGAVKTLSVNFYGLRALTEALAPKLRDGAAVVNLASLAGYGWRTEVERARDLCDAEGFPEVEALVARHGIGDAESYPVSKQVLILWTQRAAHQPLFKSRGIRVNAVSPGPVETPILSDFRQVLGDEKVDGDVARAGRAGIAEDIAPPVLFLCSDAARWINGANIPVDGGVEASINADVIGF